MEDFLLLYGSQTGIAKGIAEDLQTEAESRGYKVRLHGMEDFKKLKLENEDVVVVICSTTGEGEAPDNASRFWRRLKKKSLSKDHLKNLKYTVLGLGDTNYTNFCQMGKNFDNRFAELGATRFFPSGFADDGIGLELVVEPWKTNFWAALAKVAKCSGPVAAQPADEVVNVDVESVKAEVVENNEESNGTAHEDVKPKLHLPRLAPSFLRVQPQTEVKDNFATDNVTSLEERKTFQACLAAYRLLSTPEAVRRTLEIEIKCEEDIDYHPGDVFGIHPNNCPSEVKTLVQLLGLEDTIDSPVNFVAQESKKSRVKHLESCGTVREALTCACDLRAPLKKGNLRVLAESAADETEKYHLQLLSAKEGATEYNSLVSKGTTISEILETHPSCKPSIARVLELLPPLQPRYYSVTSSPDVHKGTLRFAFNIVGNSLPETAGRERKGVCTGWLDTLCRAIHEGPALRDWVDTTSTDTAAMAREFKQMNLYSPQGSDHPLTLTLFHRNSMKPFRLPKDLSVPVVMIGPGTGVAPFMGFLHHRAHVKSVEGKTFAPMWLYGGCRHKDHDFLFQKEIDEFLETSTLDRFRMAFSREDDDTPKYCQDHVLADGAEFVELLVNQKASIYVCGTTKMATCISAAIQETLEKHLPCSAEDAKKMIADLHSNARYHQDLWG